MGEPQLRVGTFTLGLYPCLRLGVSASPNAVTGAGVGQHLFFAFGKPFLASNR